MKYITEICAFAIILLGCQVHSRKAAVVSNEYSLSKIDVKENNFAEVQLLDSPVFNFGSLRAGDTIVHTFRFKNVGETPLIISGATASCGCTVADFSKAPIPPRHIDSVVAKFNSTSQMLGFQNKVITVTYNSPKSPELFTLYGRLQ